tara:strand:- start:7160 stop:7531 length:372 start_codon:yes stop_codon:yes gene_type:complete
MDTDSRKRTLLVTRHSPYRGNTAKSALDTVLAMAVFEQPISMLFQGEGVLQLLPDQAAEVLGRSSLLRQLESLALYGIDKLFVDAHSMRRFGIDLALCSIAVSSLEESQIRDLILQHDTVLGF